MAATLALSFPGGYPQILLFQPQCGSACPFYYLSLLQPARSRFLGSSEEGMLARAGLPSLLPFQTLPGVPRLPGRIAAPSHLCLHPQPLSLHRPLCLLSAGPSPTMQFLQDLQGPALACVIPAVSWFGVLPLPPAFPSPGTPQHPESTQCALPLSASSFLLSFFFF